MKTTACFLLCFLALVYISNQQSNLRDDKIAAVAAGFPVSYSSYFLDSIVYNTQYQIDECDPSGDVACCWAPKRARAG